ncbi:hypothetical protein SAMN03080615_02869 [Amphritea atlantica]|uniref:CENP-V/GFA domain-containing protein n=1 Tax=Amphritea atlantica TaxID=355243 RepID=A0A1H9J566_9GAMM|nr:DUF6151 family protein [Amphritea atlantica]SEQ81765.1 hypothetical protein SAMN03080615_02869 [Amphritea atlantica]
MHRIQCKCGALQGHIQGSGTCSRVVCYCADCRAFTKFLGCSDEVLDAQGGSEIVQVVQPRVVFSQGQEHLAVVRLSEKGLLRWYADCCKTPIGNTLANPKVSFIGLIRPLLDQSMIEKDFGSSVAVVNVESAIGEPKPMKKGLFGVILRFIWMVLPMRISGQYRRSQLFTESGEPVVTPKVLTAEERKALKADF